MPSIPEALTRLANEIRSSEVRTASLPDFAGEAQQIAKQVNDLFKDFAQKRAQHVSRLEQELKREGFNLRSKAPVYIDVTFPGMDVPGYRTTDAYRGWGDTSTKISVWFDGDQDPAELVRLTQYMKNNYNLRLDTMWKPRSDSVSFRQA